MRKPDIAEWILSLTTTPERASSTAGDLLEEATTRGTVWFWASLVRTTASLVWRSWTEAPLTMASVALRATLLQIGVLIGVLAATTAVSLIFVAALLLFSVKPELVVKVPGSDSLWIEMTVWGIAIVMAAFGAFIIGQWIARRSRGQELPACIAYLLVQRVLWSVMQLLIGSDYGEYSSPWIAFLALGQVLEIAALFAGVHRVQSRRTMLSQ